MHLPVLLHELINGLRVKRGESVLDATVGSGGHSSALCDLLGREGSLIGIDLDTDALARARKRLSECACKILLEEGNYRNLDLILRRTGVEAVNHIIFDLGMSSDQLEHSGRGFSFRKDEPLLMTLSLPSLAPDEAGERRLTAREMINDWDAKHIADCIAGYGEERFANKIAQEIVKQRSIKAIETTAELVDVIRKAVPTWYEKKRIHFATKTFQALRITVNDEIEGLREGLKKALQLLKGDGKIAVISFHSIEDRVVKHFFKENERIEEGVIITKKPIRPSRFETKENPRARSAKLRIFQKNT